MDAASIRKSLLSDGAQDMSNQGSRGVFVTDREVRT